MGKQHYYQSIPLNTGVLLLDLMKIRSHKQFSTASAMIAFNDEWAAKLADQDIFNTIGYYYPHRYISYPVNGINVFFHVLQIIENLGT